MKTHFINEYTHEVFETEAEAMASEKKYLEAEEARKRAAEAARALEEKKKSERAERAKEVQEALKRAIATRKDYQEKLVAFCKDYGSFHFSTSDIEGFDPQDIFELIDEWF